MLPTLITKLRGQLNDETILVGVYGPLLHDGCV